MTARDTVRAVPQAPEDLRDLLDGDERAFAAGLDRHSPGMLAVARAFGADSGTAQLVVGDAWRRALQLHGAHDGTPARVALVRLMAPGHTAGAPVDLRLAAVQRELGRAITGGAVLLPSQRALRRASASVPTSAPSQTALPALVRQLPGPLRLVLLLTDVHGWPRADVQLLLGLDARAHRALLGHARRSVAEGLHDRAVSG